MTKFATKIVLQSQDEHEKKLALSVISPGTSPDCPQQVLHQNNKTPQWGQASGCHKYMFVYLSVSILISYIIIHTYIRLAQSEGFHQNNKMSGVERMLYGKKFGPKSASEVTYLDFFFKIPK